MIRQPSMDFFFPLTLEQIARQVRDDYPLTLRIIGRGEFGQRGKKREFFVILMPVGDGTFMKVPVIVPNNMIYGGMLDVARIFRKILITVTLPPCPSDTLRIVFVPYDVPDYPKLEVCKSVVYEWQRKGVWKVIKVDGKKLPV